MSERIESDLWRLQSWLARNVPTSAPVWEHLGAFGPAFIADLQAWTDELEEWA